MISHMKFDDGTDRIVLYKNKRVNMSMLRCGYVFFAFWCKMRFKKLINLIKI